MTKTQFKASISGDIVSFTSLSIEGRELLEQRLKDLVTLLDKHFSVFARVIKGDYLECYLPQPGQALRVALLVRYYIKAASDKIASGRKEAGLFRTYGIRLAIGIGEISRFDPVKGIIDGEAIYLSGRIINSQPGTHGKNAIVKSTFFIASSQQNIEDEFGPVLALLDVLIAKSTARQCEVIYLKLLGHNEEEISQTLGITQATVNQHSRSGGWNAVQKAVDRFSIAIKQLEI